MLVAVLFCFQSHACQLSLRCSLYVNKGKPLWVAFIQAPLYSLGVIWRVVQQSGSEAGNKAATKPEATRK